jgi:hypothetical protein
MRRNGGQHVRHIGVKWFVLVVVITTGGEPYGWGAQSGVPTKPLVDRFPFAKGGVDILVPVRVAGKAHLFVVDTGASLTLVDTSLTLGQPREVVGMDGPQGKLEVGMYDPPDALVGRTPLRPLGLVAGKDLRSLRQYSGLPIDGILGMDFLGRFVVHIDFDEGELLLLRSAPRDAGEELPIAWDPGDVPYVTAQIAPKESVRFIVGTGSGGPYAGDLGVLEIRSQAGKGEFERIGSADVWDLWDVANQALYRGKILQVGRLSVQSPIFAESLGPRPNVLGRGFWSRFVVTFDFPKRRAYLRRGAEYGRPERWNSTGLHVWKRGNVVEVSSVERESPAALAGLKEGDAIDELGGLKADRTSQFELYLALCKGGPTECVIRRGSQVRRLTIRSGH